MRAIFTFPKDMNQRETLLANLIEVAKTYLEQTGRSLPIHGEIGELVAEVNYGVVRHRVGAAGSDGKIKGDYIEVKTITPEKKKARVRAKRKGNFNKLVVVKIERNFSYESRMIDRIILKKGKGKFVSVSWNTLPKASENETA